MQLFSIIKRVKHARWGEPPLRIRVRHVVSYCKLDSTRSRYRQRSTPPLIASLLSFNIEDTSSFTMEDAKVKQEVARNPPATDCTACRLTGFAAFSGLGIYALDIARKDGAFAKIRPKGGSFVASRVTAGLGIGEPADPQEGILGEEAILLTRPYHTFSSVFLGLGFGRLLV